LSAVRATPAAGLTAAHAAVVRDVLAAMLPNARVLMFGSRATGRARPFSDLDLLVVKPERLSLTDRVGVVDAFEQCALPFRVDIVEAAGLPAGMRQRIESELRELP
jgi:uncharacterized protein